MRFLIDAQLPQLLCERIKEAGYEAKHVKDVLAKDATDAEIWTFSITYSFVVVTKDEDFVRRLQSGATGPTVVWIRLGNCTNRALWSVLAPLWPAVISAIDNDERIIEIQ